MSRFRCCQRNGRLMLKNRKDADTVGGIVTCVIKTPVGLGEPVSKNYIQS